MRAAYRLRNLRKVLMDKHKTTLRDLYRSLELPGKNPLKDLHIALDRAVAKAYGFDRGDILVYLLNLNFEIAEKEKNGAYVLGPGFLKE
jgi:hypothetical protein